MYNKENKDSPNHYLWISYFEYRHSASWTFDLYLIYYYLYTTDITNNVIKQLILRINLRRSYKYCILFLV